MVILASCKYINGKCSMNNKKEKTCIEQRHVPDREKKIVTNK